MAKLKNAKLDIDSVVKRMVEVSGSKTNQELASLLGLTPPALNQLKKRQSISLHLLMMIAEKFEASLDYLVYGREYAVPLYPPQDEGYIEIEPLHIENGKSIFFPKELLPAVQKKGFFLQSYVLGEKIWIINVADRHVVDGMFAFGDSTRPVFFECRVQWDGNVLIGDNSEPKTFDDITNVGILGRVVWQGFAA